ncbi:DnaJ family domain-containing protein [Nocardia sp. NPDC052316]|uniref:DnaJ family domain-containing protein n=1 Tax=Nocardia sp. NPDC052316 TaxID=3364329 RepID=UPI0037C8CBA8
MTERKPAKLDFESWIDKQIREATERGEFENLPGAGKPIPRGSDDENWWLKGYLRKEGVSGDALLPPSLLLRRDIERLPDTVRELNSERAVRETVRELNKRVVDWLRLPHGPYVRIAPVDTEEIVEQWRAERRPKPAPGASASTSSPAPHTTSWWRRLFRNPHAAPNN